MIFSLLVAFAVALLVFGVWYPAPYPDIAGGLHLFMMVILVDLTLGPLATATVSSPGKAKREWRADVALIVLLQLGALVYGVWTIHQARPVYMAFEIDRFRVVHAVDVDHDLLMRAPEGLNVLPKWGPRLVALRPFVNAAEKAEATLAALQGVELGFRADLWMPIELASDTLRAALIPMTNFVEKHPAQSAALTQQLTHHELSMQQLGYLPLHSKAAIWTVVIDKATLSPVLYLPVDPYD